MNKSIYRTRKMAVCAMLGAVSAVLMFSGFNVPFMPSFIKLDFSELPALMAAYSYGPMRSVAVCGIKNILNLPFTRTGGVGEFANFVLGCMLTVPAGLVYRHIHSKTGAVTGAALGTIIMAVGSVAVNYFIVYPVYTVFMPTETILGMYRAINPNIENLMQALVMFNMPFTLLKGGLNTLMAVLIYKPLSPVLKGKR